MSLLRGGTESRCDREGERQGRPTRQERAAGFAAQEGREGRLVKPPNHCSHLESEPQLWRPPRLRTAHVDPLCAEDVGAGVVSPK